MEAKRIGKENLLNFCMKVFEHRDVGSQDAGTCADALIAADIRSIYSHGVARLKRYVNGLTEDLMKPDCPRTVLK